MSKGGSGSRLRTKERRAKEKRGKKAAMQARYQKWAEEGNNNKSFRARKRSHDKHKIRLRNPNPGNLGCLVSHPEVMPHLVHMKLLQRLGFKGQFTSRYNKEVNAFISEHKLDAAWPSVGRDAAIRILRGK